MGAHPSHVAAEGRAVRSEARENVGENYLKDPKGLSNGEKKSITDPLFFLDFADSFLLRVWIPSFFIVKGLGT